MPQLTVTCEAQADLHEAMGSYAMATALRSTLDTDVLAVSMVSLVKRQPTPRPVSLSKQRVSLVHPGREDKPCLDDVLGALIEAFEGRTGITSFGLYDDRERFIEFVAFRVDGGDTDALKFCEDCEQAHHEDDGHAFSDKHYCDDCFEQYTTCDDCGDLESRDEITMVFGEEFVCVSCRQRNYSSCDQCDAWHHDDNVTNVLGNTVCEPCRDRHCSFCDDCDEYYYDSDGCTGEHDDDDDEDSYCCDSPARQFTVPNGEFVLCNDTRTTVTLPTGFIDDEGIQRMRRALERAEQWSASYIVGALDRRWQTKEGNFTKRLGKALHKENGTKLDSQLVSTIGNIAREHSSGTAAFHVEVTRELNMSARDFAHSDSCWWQSYSASRCSLKANGGFGLRSFSSGDEASYGHVTGRAWVMPAKLVERAPVVNTGCGDETCCPTPKPKPGLTPTFDTHKADAFVVFNGYGDMSGYTAARIVSQMVGMTYRKIDFGCSPMYVNGESGYLIAPEDLASQYTDGSLYFSTHYHSDLFSEEREAARRAALPTNSVTESALSTLINDTTSEVSYA